MSEDTYPTDTRSTVNRLKARAAYDYGSIHGIVNSCPILHVSFVPSATDPFPTILPMIGAVGSFVSPATPLADGPLDLYLHGHATSRLMRLPSTSDEEGLPLCVAASHCDGLVLALSPFHHSMNYRSAVLHGYASLVTSDEEKIYAMTLITNKVVPTRWENSRSETFKSELQSTSILKVSIVSASAKIRTGGPNEDRKDEENESVRGTIWTGVVPTWTGYGEPVPAAENKVPLPGYLAHFVASGNTRGEQRANAALVVPAAKK